MFTQEITQNTVNNVTLTSSINPSELEREVYWNSFYEASSPKRNTPSQFATFIANEFPFLNWVIDIGCGNGRDSLFFHEAGYNIIGIDGSSSAIQKSLSTMNESKYNDVSSTFICEKIDQLQFHSEFINNAQKISKIIYSRFFLHAINEQEEESFVQIASEISCPGDVLALEFRTTNDQYRPKVTGAHYRRFIEPSKLIEKLNQTNKWKKIYQIEGVGLAKFKSDDAYVCRLIFVASDKVTQ